MTQAPYFFSTALEPVPYIPTVQDVEGYEKRKLRQIQRDEQALARRVTAIDIERREGRNDAEPDNPGCEEELLAIDAERERIANEREFAVRNASSMVERYPVPQEFTIALPTTVEREQINSRLVSLGLSQVTQEQIRATLIEELYNVDWRPDDHEGEWDANQNEGVAEEKANFLDSCWLRQNAHDALINEWQEQELERLMDQAEGAPARPRAETPPKIISIREQARMELLIGDMMTRSQRLRDLAASNMDFARRNAMLLVRIHVIAVNFPTDVPLERDRFKNVLSEKAVNALREKVDDESWSDLIQYLNGLYIVDGAEVKNSDSRHENLPLPSGSIEPNDSQADSGGSSTDSSSSPAPAAASEKTTDRSSDCTTACEADPDSTQAKPSLTVVD